MTTEQTVQLTLTKQQAEDLLRILSYVALDGPDYEWGVAEGLCHYVEKAVRA